MTKNDLINDVAYELRDSMTKEQIDRMKIRLNTFYSLGVAKIPNRNHTRLEFCRRYSLLFSVNSL